MDLSVCDLECGLGGWSIGFHRAGFRCVGVDVVDVGYPYDLYQADIRTVTGADLRRQNSGQDFTAVVASPPCTEFSQITNLSYKKGQRGPPDPKKGMELVLQTKRVIDELKPKYWVLENVMGAREYIDPVLGKPALVTRPWVLWGKFPQLLFDQEPIPRTKGFHAQKDPESGKWFVGVRSWSTPKNFSQLNDWKKGKGGTRLGLPEDFPFDPLRSWKRARIPVWLALSIATAIKEGLGIGTQEE